MLLISALLLQRFCMIGYLNAMLDHLQKKKEEHSKNTQQRSHVTRLTVEICSISIIYTSESEISEISAKVSWVSIYLKFCFVIQFMILLKYCKIMNFDYREYTFF